MGASGGTREMWKHNPTHKDFVIYDGLAFLDNISERV